MPLLKNLPDQISWSIRICPASQRFNWEVFVTINKIWLNWTDSCVKTSFEGCPNGRTNARTPARTSHLWMSKDGQNDKKCSISSIPREKRSLNRTLGVLRLKYPPNGILAYLEQFSVQETVPRHRFVLTYE